MKAYDAKFRAEVLAAYDAGEERRLIALRFKVSPAWVRRIAQQRRETNQLAAKTPAPRKPAWLAWADWLKAKVAARPDIYLRELQEDLLRERGEAVCLTTICKACSALGLTRKKRLSSPENRSDPTLPSGARSGGKGKRRSTRPASSSSTKRGRKRT